MFFRNNLVIIEPSFSEEIFEKGGFTMTNADLVWHLMEQLQQKEKELNQALEIIQKHNLLDCLKQEEAN